VSRAETLPRAHFVTSGAVKVSTVRKRSPGARVPGETPPVVVATGYSTLLECASALRGRRWLGTPVGGQGAILGPVAEVLLLVAARQGVTRGCHHETAVLDPTGHNEFRTFYSDHHPVLFRLRMSVVDDD